MSNNRPSETDVLRAALGPDKECPSIEDLEQVSTGVISPSTAVARHIQSCSYCQTELQMLQTFNANDAQAGAEVNKVISRLQANSAKIFPQPARSKSPIPWWKAAFSTRGLAQASVAMAAVLLVAAVVLRLQTPKSPSLDGTQTGQQVFRSGSFVLIGPVGDLPDRPAEIRWKRVQNAAIYRVRLLEVDQSEMWRAETTEDHISVPSSIRARIVPAKTLFCEIDALDSSGTKIGETGLVRFRWAPNINGHE